MATVANLVTILGVEDTSFTAGMRRAQQQTRDFRATQERELRAASAAADTYSRSLRGSLGNVAQQVQDVTVQFQSGTSAAIIFAQQGPQIASAFGPAGAAIGAVAAIAVVAASSFLGLGKDVDTAKAATDAMEAATKSLDGTIAGTASSVDDLARKYRVLSEEMRVIERLELGKTIRESEAAISAALDQVEAAVSAAESSGQLALLRQSELLARLDPGAARDAGVAQTQAFLEGMQDALSSVREGGSLTVFADQIDRLATSLPEAGKEARDLADSFIAPAKNVSQLSQALTKAETALMALEGQRASGPDPFLDQAKAAEQAEKAVEKTAKAAERAAAQADRRQDALRLEIEQNQRLIEAGAKSAAAYEETKRQIEAENKARNAGLDASSREVKILAEQNRVLEEQAEARKRNARALEEAAKGIESVYEDIGKRIDSLFGEENREQQREIETLQRNLQQNVASAIERGFEDGFGSVGDLADQFGSLLKSTVATALADSLITKGIAESLSKALGTQLSQIAPSLAGTQAGAVTVGGAGAAGLGAAFGGYAIGQQFDGNRAYGTLGGAAGGAALGFAVGNVPGAIAGGLIGGVAGYFGSGSTGGTRNNNFQAGFNPLTGLPVEFQNTKPDAANQQAVAAVIAEIATLREGLRATGIAFGEIGELVIQAGNKSGLTLNGEQFSSQGALTEAALRQLLTGAQGLTAGQQTVLANSQARDAAGLLNDLAIPQAIERLINPLDQFELAMEEINRVFREANDNAKRLGLSTEGLAEARRRELQAVRDAAREQREAERAAREAARQAREDARRARFESQRDTILGQIGENANIIRADFGRRRGLIDDRRSDIAGARDTLTGLRDALLTSDLGGRSLAQQLSATESLFGQAVGDARAGNTTQAEAARLAELAPILIEQTRAAYGSSQASSDRTREILAITNQLTGGLNREQRQLGIAEKQLNIIERTFEQRLPAELRAIRDGNAQNAARAEARIAKLEEQLQALNDNLEALARRRA